MQTSSFAKAAPFIFLVLAGLCGAAGVVVDLLVLATRANAIAPAPLDMLIMVLAMDAAVLVLALVAFVSALSGRYGLAWKAAFPCLLLGAAALLVAGTPFTLVGGILGIIAAALLRSRELARAIEDADADAGAS